MSYDSPIAKFASYSANTLVPSLILTVQILATEPEVLLIVILFTFLCTPAPGDAQIVVVVAVEIATALVVCPGVIVPALLST